MVESETQEDLDSVSILSFFSYYFHVTKLIFAQRERLMPMDSYKYF